MVGFPQPPFSPEAAKNPKERFHPGVTGIARVHGVRDRLKA
jgi:hypothetical protein